jgi:hypothetical protein
VRVVENFPSFSQGLQRISRLAVRLAFYRGKSEFFDGIRAFFRVFLDCTTVLQTATGEVLPRLYEAGFTAANQLRATSAGCVAGNRAFPDPGIGFHIAKLEPPSVTPVLFSALFRWYFVNRKEGLSND